MISICVGLFIVWWGWIGFNAGSSYGITNRKLGLAARAGAGTTLASMSAGMTGIFISLTKHKGKVDVFEVVSSVLSGLGEVRFDQLATRINTFNYSRYQFWLFHVFNVLSCYSWRLCRCFSTVCWPTHRKIVRHRM